MKITTLVTILLGLSGGTLARPAHGSRRGTDSLATILPRQNQNISPCVSACYVSIFPKYDCPDPLECICNNKALSADLGACTLASKCDVADLLRGNQIQAQICGKPKRNRSMKLVATIYALLAVALIFALMRALARAKWSGGAGFGMDDWTLFACCIPMLGVSISGLIGVKYGIGQDLYELDLEQLRSALQYFYIGNVFYAPVTFGTKISFVLLYLRIWKDSNMFFRRTCWAMVVVLICALISFEFSTILICTPPNYAWDQLFGVRGHCIHRTAQLFTNSSVNIAFDVVVLLLPVPNILQANLNGLKKSGLLATFFVGFAATASSAVQLYFLVKKVETTTDPTWDYLDIALWRVTEMDLSIICCCMPMLAGLFRRAFRTVNWSDKVSELYNNTSFSNSSKSGNRSVVSSHWSAKSSTNARRASSKCTHCAHCQNKTRIPSAAGTVLEDEIRMVRTPEPGKDQWIALEQLPEAARSPRPKSVSFGKHMTNTPPQLTLKHTENVQIHPLRSQGLSPGLEEGRGWGILEEEEPRRASVSQPSSTDSEDWLSYNSIIYPQEPAPTASRRQAPRGGLGRTNSYTKSAELKNLRNSPSTLSPREPDHRLSRAGLRPLGEESVEDLRHAGEDIPWQKQS